MDRLLKFEKLAPRIVEAHVILKKEKYIYYAEITLLAKNLRAFGEGREKTNIFAAFDLACDKVAKQLKKHRGKIKDHRKEHGAKAEAPKVKTARRILEDAEGAEESPEVVALKPGEAKPMSIEEASMQLNMSDDRFIVFSNAETKSVSVIFKRDDGNHGLIEPRK